MKVKGVIISEEDYIRIKEEEKQNNATNFTHKEIVKSLIANKYEINNPGTMQQEIHIALDFDALINILKSMKLVPAETTHIEISKVGRRGYL